MIYRVVNFLLTKILKRRISIKGSNAANRRNKKLTFKNDTSFRSCISKIDNAFIDNAENLGIVMPMYNLLEYSDSYSVTSGSLWNDYRGEVNDSANENNNVNSYRICSNEKTTSKSSEYKTKLIGSPSDNNSRLNTEVSNLLTLTLTLTQIFKIFE